MKLTLKDVTLKSDTEKDIEDGIDEESIQKFIYYIKNRIEDANFLIENRIDMMDADTLYAALRKVFDISFDQSDYLKMLSKKENRHYIGYIIIKTNMMNNGHNINLYGIATSKVIFYDNTFLDIKTLRKITSTGDFLVLNEEIEEEKTNHHEKYENYRYIDVDLKAKTISEDSELLPYVKELIRKEVLVKDVLYDLKWYVKEIIFQSRCITDLANSKNETLAQIGKKYKKALDKAFNEREIPKREKISVRKHRKIKVSRNS